MKYIYVIAVITAALCPEPARAQGGSHRGVEVWVGGADWAGDDVEDFGPGVRGGAIFFAAATNRIGMGLDALIGRFDVKSDGHANELGLGAAVRYAFGPRRGVHFFADARTGWHRISSSPNGVDVSQDGFSIGPALGLEIPVGRTTRLVVSSEISWKTYRDARLLGNGPSIGDTSGSVFHYGIRLGLALGRGL